MLHFVIRNTFLLLIQGPLWISSIQCISISVYSIQCILVVYSVISRHTWSCIDCIQGQSVPAAGVISQTECPLGWRIFMPFLPTVECLHVLKWYSLAYLQQLYGAVITARVWMSIYKDLIHDIVWTQCGVLVRLITRVSLVARSTVWPTVWYTCSTPWVSDEIHFHPLCQ